MVCSDFHFQAERRKLFVWGQELGGDHWQEFLSRCEKRKIHRDSGGLAPTQCDVFNASQNCIGMDGSLWGYYGGSYQRCMVTGKSQK